MHNLKTKADQLKAVKRHFNMNCDICLAPVSSFTDVIKHYKEVHNCGGYLICKCEKKFNKYNEIREHCDWHEHPEDFK